MHKNSFLFFLMFIVFQVNAQSSEKQSKKNKIKPYYVYADTGFTVIKPEKGTWIKGYYEGDSLIKIETWFGFNYGELHREYFYWGNNLIIVNETQKVYNNTNGNFVDVDSIKPNYTARYLFDGNKLTSIKQEGNYSFMDIPAGKQMMQDTFLEMSKNYMQFVEELKKKKKNRIKYKLK